MLDEREILNILGIELSQAAGGNENDMIDSNRQAALATYLGQPNGKEVEGRSTVVSTDVADAIEWIMPEIVKAFTQNNEVVTFDANFDGDEKQAELESQYVYDVLMKENNGFINIHEFIKDALMQKNGFFKVGYERCDRVSTERYTGISAEALNVLISSPKIEITELTENVIEGPMPDQPIPVYDVKVEHSYEKGNTVVCCVPPEEFRFNKMHDSIDLSGARFCAHVVLKTAGEIISEYGLSKEEVDEVPASEVYEDDREYRFYMQGETVEPDRNISADPANRLIEVAECYIWMDQDEDGVAEYYRIVTAGGDEPTHILEQEEIECNPFISGTAILMSHKLLGLSIYDRLKEIQEQKTSLWRNIFDNLYLQNNQRTVVLEGQVNLDDLMLSRPGGIIRAKRPGAVEPYVTPPLSGDAYKMMDYLDQVRAARAGVSPEGTVQDQNIGDRVGSEGLIKMMNQKEELVGLMVRVIAETAIKPLCYKIRDHLVKHHDTAVNYQFKGKWVQFNPTTWKERSNTTVRVGTGSGNRKEQMQAITQIMLMQEKILANPKQALVQEAQVYAAGNDFAKFGGLPGIGKYLIDPNSDIGKQFKAQVDQGAKQQQEMEMKEKQLLAETQSKIATAESEKAKAAMANVRLKGQVETQKNLIQVNKQEADASIAMLKQQLAEAETLINSDEQTEEMRFKYWEANEKFRLQDKQIEATAKAARENNKDDGSRTSSSGD